MRSAMAGLLVVMGMGCGNGGATPDAAPMCPERQDCEQIVSSVDQCLSYDELCGPHGGGGGSWDCCYCEYDPRTGLASWNVLFTECGSPMRPDANLDIDAAADAGTDAAADASVDAAL